MNVTSVRHLTMHLPQSIYLRVVSNNFNKWLFYESISIKCFFFFSFLILSPLASCSGMVSVYLLQPGLYIRCPGPGSR